MKMDRELQRQILIALKDVYPENIVEDKLPGQDTDNFQPTLYYLYEHDLIDASPREVIGAERQLLWPRITARGLDFIEDDGGISAILNTVTVRFNAEELRTMLAIKVGTADLPQAEKEGLAHTIQSLPADGLRHVTMRLLDAAMDRLPGALQLLQTSVGQYV